jgi:hypothetical protein
MIYGNDVYMFQDDSHLIVRIQDVSSDEKHQHRLREYAVFFNYPDHFNGVKSILKFTTSVQYQLTRINRWSVEYESPTSTQITPFCSANQFLDAQHYPLCAPCQTGT